MWRIIHLRDRWKNEKVIGGKFPFNNIVMHHESYKVIDGYRITTDKNEMDINIIHSYISKSYWANGIPIDVLKKAIENSLCFAVLTTNGELVGFSRMITDYATYAYLADVFVSEAHRGKGLSKELLTTITEHPLLQGLRRVTLATRDAHDLYKKFGFTELASPEIFMERWVPNIYKNA